ncbi:MAG: collagen-like protein [Chloracidobacterium sp.]|uniref:Collagen-like protein n=1 Tax=Chloracidobacterium validum TaxID=2821543 RepID=A0ABX8B6K3_9BACT|nr:collagen-like protein [Chloracidobacterium validum]QUW02299.1 collagen-like protein [Chloracidobacterium validum]
MTHRHAPASLSVWRLALAFTLTLFLTSPGLALRALVSRQPQATKSTGKPTKPLEIMVLRPQGSPPTPPTPTEVEAFTKLITGQSNPFSRPPETVRAAAALNFRPAAALLRRLGVGFEPYLLLHDDWYRLLWSTLKSLPQFQSRVVVGQQAQGLCIGDTVVLPERALVTDDLVIIARQLEVAGKTLELRGPHGIYVFQAEPARFTQAAKGHITLNASGCGYQEWREAVEHPNSVTAQLCPPFYGAPGSPGNAGNRGENGANGESPPPARNGSCDNANTIDGTDGADASDGMAGAPGEHGSHGYEGQKGKPIHCDIPAGDQNEYTFTSIGGVGGIGGRGGDGGHGGDGGRGGKGGDGVDCGCQFGRAGNGGKGGRSGKGGDGGDAGRGGNGGDGGAGGTVTFTYCPPRPFYQQNIEGGLGGFTGSSGTPGTAGKNPFGGEGGKAGASFSCSGKAGANGQITILAPRNGHFPLDAPQPGRQGSHGSVSHTQRQNCPPPPPPVQPDPPGGGGPGGTPSYQCFSWCYYVSYDGGRSWHFVSCDFAGCWAVIAW